MHVEWILEGHGTDPLLVYDGPAFRSYGFDGPALEALEYCYVARTVVPVRHEVPDAEVGDGGWLHGHHALRH